MQELNNTQRDYLRKMAHSLKPVVQIGKNGVSDAVIATIKDALDAHELIKVRFMDAQDERKAIAEEIATASDSNLISVIGNVVTLYREQSDPDERTITLPSKRDERQR